METVSRIFVGETGTQAFDGFAGFRIGQVYELEVQRLPGDEVAITLPHGSPGAAPLRVSLRDFNTWWQAMPG